MRIRPAFPFQKSLLAAAVILASGCATTAPGQPDDAGFSGPLVDAGRATADLTSRALRRTGYLLGLTDDAGDAAPPMDEVDLAMLEEDAMMPDETITVAGVERIDAETSDDGLAVARFVAADEASVDDVAGVEALVDGSREAAARPIVALNDYTHTVGADETLWDIARKTTGDATNWHVLADVNDLGQDASVYPGQDLTVPADMLRPELASATLAAAPVAAPAPGALESVQAVASAPAATVPTSPVAPAVGAPEDGARGFTVRAGETLWEFARRTTGDATEWQAIAAQNGFDEQRARTIRQGEEIFVPETLVRAELDGMEAPQPEQGALQEDRAPVTSSVALSAASPVSPRTVPIVEASAALPAESALPAATVPDTAAPIAAAEQGVTIDGEPGLDETRDMTIVEASFNEPEAERFTPPATPATDAPDEITISGTYYPKAVYNAADFSSSLLMRVSPGTRLRVAGVEGPWFAVETEDGTGYVHDRDIQ